MIHLSRPNIPKFEEIKNNLIDVFDSMMITEARSGSKYGKKFIKAICEYIPVYTATLFPNATNALMAVLRALDLKGEVITPSYTYSATANAILWAGLKPHFVDIDNTCTVNPSLVKEAINENTSAIMPVHLYGNPCNIDAITEIAQEKGLPVIYDAAHAFGSIYEGRRVGGNYMVEVFSLAAAKLVTSCEGGVITTNDTELATKLEAYKWNGNVKEEYNAICMGLSGRLSEIHSIIGIKSLELLEREIKSRYKIAKIYKEELSGIEGIEFLEERENCRQSYYVFPIFTEQNNRLLEALTKNAVEARTNYFYPPIHKMHYYKKEYGNISLPVTEERARKVLVLPIHSHMSEQDSLLVTKIIKEGYK